MMVTTTISLEEATMKSLKHFAVERGTNVRVLIREAVEEFVRENIGRKLTGGSYATPKVKKKTEVKQ